MGRTLAIASVVVAALAAGRAEAHAQLIRAKPAAGAHEAAPAAIKLQFNERIEPKFSGFDVVKADGAKVPLVAAAGPDGRTLDATPAAPLAPGSYTVSWHVVSADGHRMTGDYSFTVR